ncbi:PKD domain-containing protein [Kitasatospora sp. NPDC002965]|uniref:PKD domain-containing protein n=1 Tax=Kitasatospora sp. NPDC002965 TaxID=3154775 RepID=UPI0033B3D5B8
MRTRRALGLAATAAVVTFGLPAPAHAADPAAVLYVDNATTSNCIDTGIGTAARPYCTIQAAVDVAGPGQTVQVAPGRGYVAGLRVTRSGTADKPIVIRSDGSPAAKSPVLSGKNPGTGLEITGAQHIVVSGLTFSMSPLAVVVTDSSDIRLEANSFIENFRLTTGNPAVKLVGHTSDVSVTRNRFWFQQAGVSVDTGVQRVSIAHNDFAAPAEYAVRATGASHVSVVNNTIANVCGTAVALDGASGDGVVENNVISGASADYPFYRSQRCWYVDPAPVVSVSAAAAPTATVDYNTVHSWTGAPLYRWAGTDHTSPDSLAAATGQGKHDADQEVTFLQNLPVSGQFVDDRLPVTATSAIDSADPNAPGAAGTDLLGSSPVDHPDLPDSPAGGFLDRGAYEFHAPKSVVVGTVGSAFQTAFGPAPFAVTATATATTVWQVDLGYTFDFGDGTPVVTTGSRSADHVYATAGTYRVTATATDGRGGTVVSDPNAAPVTVTDPGPLKPQFTLGTTGDLVYTATASVPDSPWPVTLQQIDFGDGTPSQDPGTPHQYAWPGTYQVTFTVRDASQRTATATQQVDAQYSRAYLAALPGEKTGLLAMTEHALYQATGNYGNGVWSPFTNARALVGNWPLKLAGTHGGKHQFANLNGYLVTYDQGYPGATRHWDQIALPGLPGAGGNSERKNITDLSVVENGTSTKLVVAADGGLYEATADYAVGRWTGWAAITANVSFGTRITKVAAAMTGNVLHVYALGANGRLYTADGDYDRGTWRGGDLTGSIGQPGRPTELTATAVNGTVHVVALIDGSLYDVGADYNAGRWGSWGNVSAATGLGGITTFAAATTGDNLRLYAVNNGHLYDILGDYSRGWSGWGDVTSAAAAGEIPAVTAVGAWGSRQ